MCGHVRRFGTGCTTVDCFLSPSPDPGVLYRNYFERERGGGKREKASGQNSYNTRASDIVA